MRRRTTRAALAAMLGVGAPACANIWGFADLTSENRDAAPDSGVASGDAGDGGARDGTAPTPDGTSDAVGTTGCNLASNSICRGKCPGDASPCGCLPDPATQTSYCGVTGTGMQDSPCSTDLDCAPGYGCMTTMVPPFCAHWCRPTTTCPGTTVCQNSPSITYNGEVFKYCY
jgi:hypothetical protein